MKKYEKEVQQAYLDNEKDVLKKLEQNYIDSLEEINNKIAILLGRQDADLQHVIYQVQYQQSLKKQVEAILETLHSNEFETVSEYLTKSYEEGFIGAMYSLQKQGVPLVFPISQDQVVSAIQHETKLSESLYTRLGKDTKVLSKQIAGEISRGISNAAMYSEIARNISGYARIPKNNAMRIARTEAHRIQNKASMDACIKAKDKGADILRQWDATLDGKTRDTHRKLDGQIKELDEPFEVDGIKAMEPGGFGIPEEDINCRCALLQRARWALGNDYTKWDPEQPELISDNGTTQLVKIEAKDYESFKEQYKEASERVRDTVQKMNDTVVENVEQLQKYSDDLLKKHGVSVDLSDVDNVIKEAKENVDNLDKLLSEYNSTLKNFVIKKGSVSNEGGSTYWFTDTTTGMRVLPKNIKNIKAIADELGVGDNKHLLTVTHEFAHTLSSNSRKIDTDFWKEINSIKRKYKKELGYIEIGKSKYTKDEIFISNYAEKNADEFLAEAFAQAKLSKNPSKYALDVLEVVDKYFKK